MMADFLKDLPSYNKENFTNFQPNYNRLQTKTQSLFHCTNEYPDSQIIVNQKYNIVVKYLEKSVFNDKPVVLNSNKKREITNHNDGQVNESKSFKRLKTTDDVRASTGMGNISGSTSSDSSTQANETILIEIDEVDEDNEDDNQIDDV